MDILADRETSLQPAFVNEPARSLSRIGDVKFEYRWAEEHTGRLRELAAVFEKLRQVRAGALVIAPDKHVQRSHATTRCIDGSPRDSRDLRIPPVRRSRWSH